MAFTNFDTKEINCKILYLGTDGSGKSANFQKILEMTSPEVKSGLLELKPNGRTTQGFFEFLPISLGYVKDFHLKLHLYTLPQNSLYETVPSVILKGIDGFVFVADSTIEKLGVNITALEEAKRVLSSEGILPSAVPAVMQYNKRDLPSITPIEVLRAELNTARVPEIEASAHKGEGVMETLKLVSQQVIRNIAG
ncbi:gliding-motility protein MglA [bacterium]|nr:gliding-motility protein MglA [bacterium]